MNRHWTCFCGDGPWLDWNIEKRICFNFEYSIIRQLLVLVCIYLLFTVYITVYITGIDQSRLKRAYNANFSFELICSSAY